LCTLIHTPELIVLDEPTTGVDPVSRRDFWKILARLQREGLTLLLTTPYLDEAERCQRVALMDRGRILDVSTPDELRAQAEGAVIEILADPRRRAAELLGEQSEVADVQVFGERLHATLHPRLATDPAATAAHLSAVLAAAGCEVHSIRALAPSLEDLFIARVEAAGLGEPTTPSREVSA
jgi:ABC-2 type transport system ATP-binding protein